MHINLVLQGHYSSCFSISCSSKRTVDFGLSRGYSGEHRERDPGCLQPVTQANFCSFLFILGAQEAKHRMAMAVANFAGGPGRKRRFEGIML